MTIVTLDGLETAVLGHDDELLEIRDRKGRVLGYYMPTKYRRRVMSSSENGVGTFVALAETTVPKGGSA